MAAGVGLLRGALGAWLRDRALVLRATSISDGAGGEIVTLLPVETVACRLEAEALQPNERQEAGRTAAVSVWTAFLPHGTPLYPQDVLEIGDRRYEVVDHDDAQTDSVVQAVNLRLAR